MANVKVNLKNRPDETVEVDESELPWLESIGLLDPEKSAKREQKDSK